MLGLGPVLFGVGLDPATRDIGGHVMWLLSAAAPADFLVKKKSSPYGKFEV